MKAPRIEEAERGNNKNKAKQLIRTPAFDLGRPMMNELTSASLANFVSPMTYTLADTGNQSVTYNAAQITGSLKQ